MLRPQKEEPDRTRETDKKPESTNIPWILFLITLLPAPFPMSLLLEFLHFPSCKFLCLTEIKLQQAYYGPSQSPFLASKIR